MVEEEQISNSMNIIAGGRTHVLLPVFDAIVVTLDNIRRRIKVNMMGALVA